MRDAIRNPAGRRLASSVLLLAAALAACTTPVDSDGAFTIEPAEAVVAPGETKSFRALTTGVASTAVTWSVSGGALTESGNSIDWTAPAEPGEYTLTATSDESPSRTATATVRVVAPEGFFGSSFSGYRGYAASLPPGMFVTGEDRSGRQIENGFDPFTGVSDFTSDPPDAFDGFGAFTSDGQTFSFGIRERGAVDLRESRLFLAYTNDSDRAIAAFEVAYDVGVWRLGERANRVRLKFNTATSGFGGLPDIASTVNPRGRATGPDVGRVVDGTRPENRVAVTVRVELADLPDPHGMPFGVLAPGQTGYFRWQYSNADASEGEVRSALAISNVRVVPIYADRPPPRVGSGPLEFSHEPGFYTEPFQLELRSSLAGATLYYTVDGSAPDPARVMSDAEWGATPVEMRARTFVYDGPIDIATLVDRPNEVSLIPTNRFESLQMSFPWAPPEGEVEKAAVIRAAAGRDGRVEVRETRSFFLTARGRGRYTLPVVSLTTDREHLFAPDSGIYVAGHRDFENYLRRGREWERPAHMEFFETTGFRPLAQEIGVRIHGGWTRHHPQKSLRLYSRSDYGTSRFGYRFFASKPLDDFNRLILRNAGNDWNVAIMRDAALQSLVHHLPFGTQHYRPVTVFINGEYWGVHGLRDRLDEHYIETHYGVPRDRVAILGAGVELTDPEPEELHYLELLELLRNGQIWSSDHLNVYMDVDGYLDYVIAQIYAGNDDWPHSNVAFWRYTGPDPSSQPGPRDGRWRWLMFDVDRAFGLSSANDVNMVRYVFGSEPWFDLFRGIMGFQSIRREFIQRTAVHLATAFEPVRVRREIERIAAELEPELPERIARWGVPRSTEEWRAHVGTILDFAAQRPEIVRRHMVQHFPEVDGTAQLEIGNLPPGRRLTLHTLPIGPSTPGVVITDRRWRVELFTGVPVVLRSDAFDLRDAQVSGAYEQLVATVDEVRFVLTGDARLELP